jgi:hypothetical protein
VGLKPSPTARRGQNPIAPTLSRWRRALLLVHNGNRYAAAMRSRFRRWVKTRTPLRRPKVRFRHVQAERPFACHLFCAIEAPFTTVR